MKFLSVLVLGTALFLNACLSDSDSEDEDQKSSSSVTEVSSSSKKTSSSSSIATANSSSSGTSAKSSSSTKTNSSSSESKELSSSEEYPYYSSGVFCFTEGCEENISSSSEEPSSSSVEEPIIEGDQMTDLRDNQKYDIISLDDKIWMLQNINYVTSSGSTCYDNEEINCDVYGRLYTYAAAQSACPSGWHIATRAEYELAMANSSFVWNYAGRMKDNTYDFIDGMGFNWVSSKPADTDDFNCDTSSNDCGVILVQKNPDSDYAADPALFFQVDIQTKGFSVRCVKN